MRGLCLGFTNPVRRVGVLDVCLCLGLGGEWVGGFDQDLEGWGGVMSGLSVYCAWRIPAHLRCTQCSLMDICFLTCIFMADISNPDSFVCCCQTWIFLDITRFYN